MLAEERVASHIIPAAPAAADARETVVIVGNGMASHKLCERLVLASASTRLRIVVLAEEQIPAYDRVRLTEFLGGRTPAELTLASHDWYRENGIELHLGRRVAAIDREMRVVVVDDGGQFVYDKLVFATGSRVFRPPMEGVDLPGVHVYRTVRDLAAIQEHSAHARSAAILGGGLLGLEAARALQTLGVSCHVIEYGPHVLCSQLDPRAGALANAKIESLGIRVRVDTRVARITAEGDRRLLHFTGEEEPMAVDMVVMATGVRPRHELAQACGLKTAMAGGISINERLQTSDPNVYAIGECAAFKGVSYGLVAPGYRMAEILADNLMGVPSEFNGADQSTRLKVLGLDVAVIGEHKQRGQVLTWEADGVHRRVVIWQGRIIGASALGDWPEVRRIQDAVIQQRRVWGWQLARFQRAGRLWRTTAQSVAAMPDNATLCNCMNVSCGIVRRAFQSGCVTVESLAGATGASTLCGSCKPLLAELSGAPVPASPQVSRGSRGLAGAAIIAALLCIAIAVLPHVTYAASVQGFPYDTIWRNGVLKQTTGFTLLGLSLAGMALSVRKRWRVAATRKWGDFGYWRMAHGMIGALGLVILLAHTGMRFGAHLNFALMSIFTAANLFGAIAGGAASFEQRLSTASGMKLRRWITWVHVLFVWPLPVLIGFHILSVYYF